MPVVDSPADGIDSADDIVITDYDDPFGLHDPEPSADTGPADYAEPASSDPGEIIDAEIVNERPLIPEDKPVKAKAKAGPPTGDEWLDFFSRIVLRFTTEWYVDNVAFRGIDEEDITDRDRARLYLTKDERQTIAAPFAEYANKNPWARKHGREIVSLATSFESLVILGAWFSRVNRIAKKYRPQKRRAVPAQVRDLNGQNEYPQDPTGGRIPGGFGIINPGGS